MKILLVSGSYPPEPCGVGDYTYQLLGALQHEGIDADLFRHKEWGASKVSALLRKMDALASDVIHIQYPSVGYGRSLGPQILSLNRPCVITIHEVSQAHTVRKMSLYGFFLSARKLIFTTKFERQFATRYAPWISSRSTVIPIGSNVPVSSIKSGHALDTVGYFGLIRPKKGLEQVIELARIIARRGLRFKLLVVGSVSDQNRDYYHKLRAQSTGLPIEWRIGMEGEALDAALAKPAIAYLPFPDGASERRSSLLAFLSRGTPVITTDGAQTPEELKRAVQFASTPAAALLLVETLANNDDLRNDLREKGIAYAKMFSWGAIARCHANVYEAMMRTAKP